MHNLRVVRLGVVDGRGLVRAAGGQGGGGVGEGKARGTVRMWEADPPQCRSGVGREGDEPAGRSEDRSCCSESAASAMAAHKPWQVCLA